MKKSIIPVVLAGVVSSVAMVISFKALKEVNEVKKGIDDLDEQVSKNSSELTGVVDEWKSMKGSISEKAKIMSETAEKAKTLLDMISRTFQEKVDLEVVKDEELDDSLETEKVEDEESDISPELEQETAENKEKS